MASSWLIISISLFPVPYSGTAGIRTSKYVFEFFFFFSFKILLSCTGLHKVIRIQILNVFQIE